MGFVYGAYILPRFYGSIPSLGKYVSGCHFNCFSLALFDRVTGIACYRQVAAFYGQAVGITVLVGYELHLYVASSYIPVAEHGAWFTSFNCDMFVACYSGMLLKSFGKPYTFGIH